MRNRQPRKPPLYDSRIHGRADYDSRVFDDEPDEDVEARTRLLDALAGEKPEVKRSGLELVQ